MLDRGCTGTIRKPGTLLRGHWLDADRASRRAPEALYDSLERRGELRDFEIDAGGSQRAQLCIEIVPKERDAACLLLTQHLGEIPHRGDDHDRPLDLFVWRPFLTSPLDHQCRLKEITAQPPGLVAHAAHFEQRAALQRADDLILDPLQSGRRTQRPEIRRRLARVSAFQKGQVLVQLIRQLMRPPLLDVDPGALSRTLAAVKEP